MEIILIVCIRVHFDFFLSTPAISLTVEILKILSSILCLNDCSHNDKDLLKESMK